MKVNKLLSMALIGVLAQTAHAQNGSDPPAWQNYQGNAAHTGYVPLTLDATKFAKLWAVTIPVQQTFQLTAVAEANGIAYVSVAGSGPAIGTYAINPKDGSVLWSTTYPGGAGTVTAPSTDAGLAFVQYTDGFGGNTLYTYEGATGLAQPTTNAGQSSITGGYLAPTVSNGRIYPGVGAGGSGSALEALVEGAGGQPVIWSDDTSRGYGIGWTPAVDATRVYSYLANGYLFSADKWSGANLSYFHTQNCCTYSAGEPMNFAVTLGAVKDALIVDTCTVTSYDTTTSNFKWMYQQSQACVAGQVSVGGGVVYVLQNGTLVALNETTGAKLWSWSTAGQTLTGAVVVTDSHVFVSGSNRTYAINTSTHSSDWSYAATGKLAVSEGLLYIANQSGALTAIGLASGSTAPATLTVSLTNAMTTTAGQPEILTTAKLTNSDTTYPAHAVVTTVHVPADFMVATMPAGLRLRSRFGDVQHVEHSGSWKAFFAHHLHLEDGQVRGGKVHGDGTCAGSKPGFVQPHDVGFQHPGHSSMRR